jgi:hypothetical protein
MYRFRFGRGLCAFGSESEGGVFVYLNSPLGEEPRCLCGALLDEDGTALCRKCAARARWRRRRANRRRHGRHDGPDPFTALTSVRGLLSGGLC